MRILVMALFAFACGDNPAPKMAAAGTIGAACGADTDCTQTGATCVQPNNVFTWTGGYCTVRDCSATVTCPDGSFCQMGHMGLGLACMYECKSNADCRTGYSCCDSSSSGTKVCAPTGSLCS